MTDPPTTDPDTADDRIREAFREFQSDGGVIGVITDPQNDSAWIASSVTCEVEQ